MAERFARPFPQPPIHLAKESLKTLSKCKKFRSQTFYVISASTAASTATWSLSATCNLELSVKYQEKFIISCAKRSQLNFVMSPLSRFMCVLHIWPKRQSDNQTDRQTGKGRRWLRLFFCLLSMPPPDRQPRQLSNKWGNGFIIKPNVELIKLLAQVLTPCLDDYRRTEAVEAETENPKKKHLSDSRREMAENRERGQEGQGGRGRNRP